MWSNFFCKLSFVTATSFDPSTDNKTSVNIRYVLLLQHPSDLDEVTSHENANLSTMKTGSIVPREIASLILGCPGQRFGSDFGYE